MAELNELDKLRLNVYRQQIPPDLFPATSADALEAALEMEETAKSMNPFDPAKLLFARKSAAYFAVAEILEKMEQA